MNILLHIGLNALLFFWFHEALESPTLAYLSYSILLGNQHFQCLMSYIHD